MCSSDLGEHAVTVTDSTFVGNDSPYQGGAIGLSGDLTVRYSTFVDNSSDANGEAIATWDTTTTVSFDHALIVGTGPGCEFSPGNTVVDAGGSVETGTSCSFTGTGSMSSASRASLKLASGLASNGAPAGRPQTIALGAGSAAIDTDSSA